MSNNKGCPKGGKGIGGQAVIEGVMMRGKGVYALAVRKPDKSISVETTKIKTSSERPSWYKLPLIRGVVGFIDSLVVGMKVTKRSAELAGLDEIEYDEESKFEKWLENRFGDKLADYLIYVSVFISVILCVGIFMALPAAVAKFLNGFFGSHNEYLGVFEGIIRIMIFVIYLILIAQMKDVKRVLMYHGAEHKTINTFEKGLPLTVENVKKNSRLHKRCGTSFLAIIMIVGMIVFYFLNTDIIWLRIISRILLSPVIAGISYELIKYAGSHDNLFVDIISAPGILMQFISTKNPNDEMIEIAIASLNAVLEVE
ncbi:MAG: DUF1385 domain-containing protein, partial [Lachnospirales bacterium]